MRRIVKATLGLIMVLVMMAAMASIASASTSASVEVSGHIVPPPQYRVVYDGNGGARDNGGWIFVGAYVRAGGADTVYSVSDTGFLRDGYTFAAWNTKKDGSGKSYAPGSRIVLYNNVTLYAQWTKDKETPDSQDRPGGGSVIGTLPGFVIPWNSDPGTGTSASTTAPHIETGKLGSGTTEMVIEDAEHLSVGAAPPDMETAGDAGAVTAASPDASDVEKTWNTGIGMTLPNMARTGDPAYTPPWVWISLLVALLATTAYLLWIVCQNKRHETQEL